MQKEDKALEVNKTKKPEKANPNGVRKLISNYQPKSRNKDKDKNIER